MRNRIKLAMNSGSANILKRTVGDDGINRTVTSSSDEDCDDNSRKDDHPIVRLTKALIREGFHIRFWRNQRAVVKGGSSSKRHAERITLSFVLFSVSILAILIIMYISYFTFHSERQYPQHSSIATLTSSTVSSRNDVKNLNNNNNNFNNYDADIKSVKNYPLESAFLNNEKGDDKNKNKVNIVRAYPNLESISRRTEEEDSSGGSSNNNASSSTSVTATSYRIISHAKVVTLETLLLSPDEQSLTSRNHNGKIVTVEDTTTDKANHDTEEHGRSIIWVAGIVLDPSNITKNVFQSIMQLNCNTTVGKNLNVHILTSSSASSTSIKATYQQYYTYQRLFDATEACGKFILSTEPSSPTSTVRQNKPRRVDAIAAARDYQRNELRNFFYKTTTNNSSTLSNSFVVLMDLDLSSIPSVHEIMKQINEMTVIPSDTSYSTNDNGNEQNSSYHDIICAAGIMYQPYGYYDTFATVLLPDTFVYPILGRLSRSLNLGEDATMIRSDDLYGTVTQFDLLDYFENFSRNETTPIQHIPGNLDPVQHAKEEVDAYIKQFVRPVPVRSCFGGFAIYRAHIYFNPRCDYSTPYQQQQYPSNGEGNEMATQDETEDEDEWLSSIKRYSSRRSERPCEHVMFHDCLHRTSGKLQQLVRVAVHPGLRTEWNERTSIFGNMLWEGATRHEGLNTYFNQRDRGERLVSPNKRYTLRINEDGRLVVEVWRTAYEKDTSATSGTILWTPTKGRSHKIFRTMRWTHMFLWLSTDGKLQLLKHVPHHSIVVTKNFSHSKQCEYSSWNTSKLTLENPCQCNIKLDMCTVLLWSIKHSLPKEEGERLSVTLSDDGVLSIISHPSENKHIVWKAPIHVKTTF